VAKAAPGSELRYLAYDLGPKAFASNAISAPSRRARVRRRLGDMLEGANASARS